MSPQGHFCRSARSSVCSKGCCVVSGVVLWGSTGPVGVEGGVSIGLTGVARRVGGGAVSATGGPWVVRIGSLSWRKSHNVCCCHVFVDELLCWQLGWCCKVGVVGVEVAGVECKGLIMTFQCWWPALGERRELANEGVDLGCSILDSSACSCF